VTPRYVCHHIGPKYRFGVYEIEKLIYCKASSSIILFALDDDDDEKKNKRSNAERKELFKFSLYKYLKAPPLTEFSVFHFRDLTKV
jgi:hypothetical protein